MVLSRKGAVPLSPGILGNVGMYYGNAPPMKKQTGVKTLHSSNLRVWVVFITTPTGGGGGVGRGYSLSLVSGPFGGGVGGG